MASEFKAELSEDKETVRVHMALDIPAIAWTTTDMGGIVTAMTAEIWRMFSDRLRVDLNKSMGLE